MTKAFLTFSQRKIRYAPELRSRRFGGYHNTSINFRSGAGKSDDDDDDDDTEDAKDMEKRFMKKIDKKIEEALQDRATVAEIQAIKLEMIPELKDLPILALRELANTEKGALAMLAAQGLEIKRLSETLAAQPKDMSIRSQCEAWMKRNEVAIKGIRDGKKLDLEPFELDLRAAATSPMLPSTVAPGGTAYINRFEIQPGINELLRPEPTFWDFIKKGNTNSETYIWLNKRPTDGAAGFIGPGVYKPSISFTINTELSNAKKIAVNEKMATELLEDIDGFMTWVITELQYQLMQKVNDTLQGAGAATSTVPAGIQTLSTPYDVLTGIKTTDANFWDALKAGTTMLRVKRFRGPIVAFVNPVDLANGVMTKAQNQGQLFIPPVTGCTIVEDLNMALGYVQFIAVDYYKVLIYKGFRMEWGLENDDFTKNLRTVIAEMRLHNFHSENYDGFAIYDTIKNITDAINVGP